MIGAAQRRGGGGDGALGFWAAAREVWPEIREQAFPYPFRSSINSYPYALCW
jgi:hypothetical protein